jgi:NAD(P)-dependent dehydrogenase (short-subunit alcohol dehydrogenase family)
MKIVILGGSGLIGTKLVNKLRDQGHEALAASPSPGVNALTGVGLAAALEGAAGVVDVTNSPSFEDAAVLRFFETSVPGKNPRLGPTRFAPWLSHVKNDGSARYTARSATLTPSDRTARV